MFSQIRFIMPTVVAPTDAGPRGSGVDMFTTRTAVIGGGVTFTHALGFTPRIVLLTTNVGNGVSYTSLTSNIIIVSNASTGDTVTMMLW